MAQRRTGVIGVFPTPQVAREAAAAAERAGADPAVIRIADRRDHVLSLEAEMVDEVEHTVMGPGNVGPFTKEMTSAIVPLTIGVGVLGVLVALPFAAIQFGGMEVWGRLLVCAVVGAAVGATVGFMIGGEFGSRRSGEHLAAEEGVTVAIDDAPPSAIDAMLALAPIRLDTIEEHGRPTGTLERDHEHPGGLRGVADHVQHRDFEE